MSNINPNDPNITSYYFSTQNPTSIYSNLQFIPPKTTKELIEETIEEIKDLLLTKNEKYGDSALSPVRIFSNSDSLEQLKVRIDDKISRVKTASLEEDEDVVLDLLGYLTLYLIALRK